MEIFKNQKKKKKMHQDQKCTIITAPLRLLTGVKLEVESRIGACI